jgi:rare lipoprotein A
VRINDRGPFLAGRLIDLSHRAADILGFVNKGSANVEVRYVSRAPLNGDDTRFLMASVNRPTQFERELGIRVATASSTDTGGDSIASLITGTLSYASAQQVDVTAAVAAAEALATGSPALMDWHDSVDQEARQISLQLVVFTDRDRAYEVALAFALLGAVDQAEFTLPGGRQAIVLTLTYLKPGVGRADIAALVRALALTDVIPR